MRAVQSAFALVVVGIVGTEALVDPAALIDPAHGLAQSVHACFFIHMKGKGLPVERKGQGIAV